MSKIPKLWCEEAHKLKNEHPLENLVADNLRDKILIQFCENI